jgi:hypothetical protein
MKGRDGILGFGRFQKRVCGVEGSELIANDYVSFLAARAETQYTWQKKKKKKI